MKEPMELFGEWLKRYEETHGEHDGWYADLVNLMQLFGQWLERYEETHGEHDGWYADLVNLWANEERGEQETLCLPLFV